MMNTKPYYRPLKKVLCLIIISIILAPTISACKKKDNIQTDLTCEEQQNEIVFKGYQVRSVTLQQDSPAMQKIKTQLKKNGFTLKVQHLDTSQTFTNFTNKEEITLNGAVSFFARRTYPEKGSKLYPDFTFDVFELENEQIAKEVFDKIQNSKTLVICGEIFDKTPHAVAQKGEQIFYFNSRAEVFRGYLNQYADLVESE